MECNCDQHALQTIDHTGRERRPDSEPGPFGNFGNMLVLEIKPVQGATRRRIVALIIIDHLIAATRIARIAGDMNRAVRRQNIRLYQWPDQQQGSGGIATRVSDEAGISNVIALSAV